MDTTAHDHPDTLLIGLGNPILGDDGVGFYIVETLEPHLNTEQVAVIKASVGGFRLMKTLAGYRRAILVDAVQLGGEPGQIYRFTPDQFRGSLRAASPHDAGLPEALELGERLGMEMPVEVIILGVEATQTTEFSEELSPAVAAAIPQAAAIIVRKLEPTLLTAVEARLRQGRIPCAAIFEVAREVGTRPRRVVGLADAMGYRTGWCQLGLFNGGPSEEEKTEADGKDPLPIPSSLREEIEERQQDGQISCAQAWGIAKRLGLDRRTVGKAANTLQIRIIDCQLGFF